MKAILHIWRRQGVEAAYRSFAQPHLHDWHTHTWVSAAQYRASSCRFCLGSGVNGRLGMYAMSRGPGSPLLLRGRASISQSLAGRLRQ